MSYTATEVPLLEVVKNASSWRTLLPLYLGGLLLGLAQLWPLWGDSGLFYNPLIRRLLQDPADALVDMNLRSDPGALAAQAGGWLGVSLLLALLLGLLYNICSGGALSVWAGRRGFGAGCGHFALPFIALSVLLTLLGSLALAAGGLAGYLGGGWAGAAVALVLLQLLNLAGECARAYAISADRRNPFVLLWRGALAPLQQPALLLVGLLGLALHAALAAGYGALAPLAGGYGALLLGQFAVLGWLWVKLLRLAACRQILATLSGGA